jgi:hypothetical protein
MSEIKSTGGSERSFRRWRRMSLVAVLVIAILIVLVVLHPWDTAPSPQSILAKAYAATTDIGSYRFSSTAISKDSDGFSTQQNIEAEYASPDRYHLKMIENGQETEFIIIGDEQYIGSGSLSGNILYASTQALSRMVSKEATVQYLDMLTDIQEQQGEKIDGVDCLHYIGKWDVEKQIDETKRSLIEAQVNMGIVPDEKEIDKQLEPMRSTEIGIELWIGRDDYLIRQMKMNGKFPDDGEGLKFVTTSWTMKYYDLNQPVTIEAPLDAEGQVLPPWRLATR